MRPVPLILLAALAGLACSSGSSNRADTAAPATATMPPTADPAAARLAIDSANARFTATMLKNDTANIGANYADDAVLMMPNEKVARGKEAAIKALAGMMSTMKVTAFAGKTEDVVVAGDYAIETGSVEMTLQPKTGKPIHDVGKYITVWKKQPDGSYKIVRDMFNSDLPAK